MSLQDRPFVLPDIRERTQIAAPGPTPMALAFENGNLWVGSAKDWIIRGIRIADAEVFAQAKAPAKPYGCVLVTDTLYVILGDVDDNRTIRSYPLGKAFTSESMRCPRDTGNFLAHDGRSLYVSQRYDQLLVKVDTGCNPVETTSMPRQVVGITYLDGLFYLLTTDGSPADDDIRLARMELVSGVATITELARVPFGARSLVHDGTCFWTSWRDNGAIVSFDLP